MNIRDHIETTSAELGLEFLGITGLSVENDYARFADWLGSGRHAGMNYLERNNEIRKNPAELLLGAKTAIIVALNYYLGDKLTPKDSSPRVAQYARLVDYHKVLRKSGEQLLASVLVQSVPGHVGRVVVDSAPILERALAAKTAAGFIGKNTLYIHPKKGSFLLLAEILTSVELPIDAPGSIDPERRAAAGGCGTCQRCQVHCPTGALDKPYSLDANKCLSYWTIEHRGPIPEHVWPWLAQYYFGCDLCQLACPYNRDVPAGTQTTKLKAAQLPSLEETALMDQPSYEKWFGGTPMTRAKREGLRRNALIALTVTKSPNLNAILDKVENSSSDVVRETARQAKNYLYAE